MRGGILFSLFIVLLSLSSDAQGQTLLLKGRVVDSATLSPVSGALVVARTRRDTTSGSHETFSDSLGNFSLELGFGGYRVSVSSDGYETFTRFVFFKGADITLDDIQLRNLATGIGLVNIKVDLPVQQKGDTTEYSASAYKVNPDATAEDLVKKLPGISFENGKVKAHGEEVKKVTLDGKDFFGNDAQTALRNLPAEVVDKIQVFDRMSDQSQFTGFDDGNSVKAINLKTKSGKANGQFGKVYAGGGTDNRYQSGLVYNNFKGDRRLTLLGMGNNINQQNFTSQDLLGLSGAGGGGGPGSGRYGPPTSSNFLVGQSNGITTTYSGGLNFNNKYGKRWTVAGNYFYNNSNNQADQKIVRTYSNSLNGTSSQLYNQNSITNNAQQNHRFNARIEYALDSNNSFIYKPSLSYQTSDYQQNITSGTRVLNSELNSSGSKYLTDGSGMSLSNELLFRHKFSKAKRTFSASGQHQYNFNQSTTNNHSENATYIPIDTGFTTDQIVKSNVPSNNYEGRLTWTEPSGKKGMWQVDYRYGLTLNGTDKKTLNLDRNTEQYSIFDTTLSNQFDTRYTTHQPGLMYRYRGEKTSIGLGAGYQMATLNGTQQFPVNTEVHKQFNNLLPRLFANIRFSKTRNLRVMFRSSTQIPSISQFQQVINTSNPILLTTGNPNLKQSLSQNLSMHYNSANTKKLTSFFAGVFATQTSQYITNATRFLGQDTQISEGFTAVRGAQISSPVNLNGYWNGRVMTYYGFPWKLIKSNMNINASYAYGRTPGLINGISNISNTHNISGGISASSNISEAIDFSVSYTTNYYQATNSSQKALNNSYFNHVASGKGNYIYKKTLVFNTELAFNKYSGLSSGYNQQFLLWNAAVGYKFFKNKSAELRISCFDLLKQNRSISRTITETYVEDNFTKVLTRYFMATFTWNFRKFANGGAEPKPDEDHHFMRPPGTPGGPGTPPPPGGRPPF